MSYKARVFACIMLCATAAWAQQSLDNAGNGYLNGNYFVRYVALTGINDNGVIGQARAISGVIAFDGKGSYTLTGQLTDSKVTPVAPANFTFTGKYTVGLNGLAVIDNPLVANEQIWGAVGVSAIAGSSTESNEVHDLFIAVPAPTGTQANSNLNGSYQVGLIDFLNGSSAQARSGIFTLTSTGAGAINAISIKGNAVNVKNDSVSQSIAGATYTLTANGSGTMTFPTTGAADQLLISGTKNVYVSSDGNTLLGGSANGFDIVVGIRAITGAKNSQFSGTYFLAGLYQDSSSFPDYSDIYSYNGGINASGNSDSMWHQRLYLVNSDPYDATFDAYPNFNSAGLDDNSDVEHMALGSNGQTFLITGDLDQYQLTFGVKARDFSAGTGVFLNPVGISNNANSAPVTNPIAPGEYISLYGNFPGVTTTTGALPFGASLGGVQVSINGRPAPIYYVSSSLIICIVPYNTPETFGHIQVTVNGQNSNVVTVYVNDTSPGIFTVPAGGFGTAAAVHLDGSVVSNSNPAKPGEVLSLYVNGLGTVTPAVTTGAAAPASPLSQVRRGDVLMYVDGLDVTTSFVGLAPGFASLYQINFTVPRGVTPRTDVYVDIDSPGAYTSHTTIRIQ